MDALELTGLLRDIAIIVFVAFSTLVMAVVVVLSVLLYRKISSALDSAKRVAKSLEEGASGLPGRLFKPLIRGGGLAFGVAQALRFLLGLQGKKGKKGRSSEE